MYVIKCDSCGKGETVNDLKQERNMNRIVILLDNSQIQHIEEVYDICCDCYEATIERIKNAIEIED